ncbi:MULTISPECIES: aromatic ring-hydroxylating oxygenase subunit alpha [Burkholderiales]|jgi:salicylate 5-hydroxylase large subunit|uniref:aromatic ring-hydroxylating oxygenase subunit alpha n=1 Tax=Burkholderiales TaxID=80840 RepID=UPI0015DBAD20|nr:MULTISPECIES: Rieske 2Fe-2S domain-containing protein [Burkholderiales]
MTRNFLRSQATEEDFPEWPTEDCSRIPNWIYSNETLYRREMERIFYGPFWTFVGLESELPTLGSWKLADIGEKSVIVTRDEDGVIHVLLNACAHRGAQVCQKKFGKSDDLTCPYHQWSYKLNGELMGVPFLRGLKGKGGFPSDFDLKQHGLQTLKVEVVNGVIFASFKNNTLPLSDYLGEELHKRFLRVFDGRKLKVLGHHRQLIKGNWKLYQDNLKDPYHATLLHVFLISFGLYRADQKGELLQDPRTLAHNITSSIANDPKDTKGTEDMTRLSSDFKLNDMRIVAPVKEYADDITIQNLTMFPALTIQQQQNSLQFRNVIPRGPGQFELSWTYFGYESDTPEMTQRRVRLANLTGPAGLVSIDDTEVFEFSNAAITPNPDRNCVVELGGRNPTPPQDFGNMVSESPIRGFYDFYRKLMFGASQ